MLPTAIPKPTTVSYGKGELQKADIYMPTNITKNAPVLFICHGGGWDTGDKANPQVIRNKAKCWLAKGWVVISTNYSLGVTSTPRIDTYSMAEDLADSIAYCQGVIRNYGGDPNRFMLMCHSAGAHLGALVVTANELLRNAGARSLMGAVLLDSAAYDVVDLMANPHPSQVYVNAFGPERPMYLRKVSPTYRMNGKTVPLLIVYSTQRAEGDMDHAEAFYDKAMRYGTDATLMPVDLPHGDINGTLGEEPLSKYSQDVIAWIDGRKRG